MKLPLLFLTFSSIIIYSQNLAGGYLAKEWNKELSVFYGNAYLTKNVFKYNADNILRFETDPLAASNSGEITTVLYKTENGDNEGLLLCFYGSYWNDAGVVYTGYNFKNLEKEKAFEFLNLLQKNIDDNKNYLYKGGTTSSTGSNIYFKYDDINVLVGYVFGDLTIRLFWNNYDSSWNSNAFEKSKRRFEKRIK